MSEIKKFDLYRKIYYSSLFKREEEKEVSSQMRQLMDMEKATEIRKINRCISEETHCSFADLYYFISHEYKNYVYTCPLKDGNMVIYKWDGKRTLYDIVDTKLIITTIIHDLSHYFRSKMERTYDKLKNIDIKKLKKDIKEEKKGIQEEADTYFGILKKVGTYSFIRDVANIYINLEINKKFLKKLNSNPYVINFKNGILDVKDDCLYIDPDEYDENMTREDVIKSQKSLSFRERDPTKDFYTFCLNFDYESTYDITIYDELQQIINNTCNNRTRDANLLKAYLGYSMLGVTWEQKCLWLVGPLACDGKSTLIEMFKEMFLEYFVDLDNRLFEKGYQKQHKQFAETLNKRVAFVEEVSRKNMDIELFKRMIGNKDLGSNEVMFGTTKDIPITFKFIFSSNNNPSFQSDAGVKRRGMLLEMDSQFLTQKDYDKRDNKTGCYLMDKKLLEKMEDDKYKLALFHIYYEYTLLYYWQGEIYPGYTNRAIKKWKGVCDDSDSMKVFIEKYCIITNKPVDKIHKDKFLNKYKRHSGLDNISFANILNDIKRFKIIYKRTGRVGGKKGALIGIKWNDIEVIRAGTENSDEEVNNTNEEPDPDDSSLESEEEKTKILITSEESEKKTTVTSSLKLNCNKPKNISSSSDEIGDYDDSGLPPEYKTEYPPNIEAINRELITISSADQSISLDGFDD